MDDWDWRTPITLARHTPVAQTQGSASLAQAALAQTRKHPLNRGRMAKAVEFAALNADTTRLVGVPVGPALRVEGLAPDRDDLLNGKPVRARKGKIALVVCGDPHDRAVSVAHQDVVSDPDRNRLVGQRVLNEKPSCHALFLARGEVCLGDAARSAALDESGDVGAPLRRERSHGVLRRHGDETDAHDGVGARGEYVQTAFAQELAVGATQLVGEGKADPLGAPDPIRLHRFHSFGPAELVEPGDELIGVVRNRQVVHRDFALFDECAAAPPTAVDHLFVGQYGLIDRVPVDAAGAQVRDTALQHAQKQPLIPSVVGRRTGRDFARPVDRQPHRLHLRLHVGDVRPRPRSGRDAVGHRRVFSR